MNSNDDVTANVEQATQAKVSWPEFIASAVLGAIAYALVYLALAHTPNAEQAIFLMVFVGLLLGFSGGVLAEWLIARALARDSLWLGFSLGTFLASGLLALLSANANSLIGLALFSLVIGAAFRYAVGLGIFVVAVVRLKSQD